MFSRGEARKIIENLFSLAGIRFIAMLLPLVILPHLSKTIGINKMGDIALVTAAMTYLLVIVDYGFSYTGTREVAKAQNDRLRIREIFFEVTMAKLILCMITLPLLVSAYLLSDYIKNNLELVLMCYVLIPLSIVFPEWIFQGIEKIRLIAAISVVAKCISACLIFTFVTDPSDYLLVPGFLAASQLACAIASLLYLNKLGVLGKANIPKFRSIGLRLKEGWDVFLNLLVPNFYNSMSYLALGFFAGSAQVAIFDVARKFLTVAEVGLTLLSRVFFPIISRDIKKHGVFISLMLYASILLSLGMCGLSYFTIDIFFSPEFELAKYVVLLMAPGAILFAIMNGYGINYLVPIGDDKALRNITISTSAVGFVMVVGLTYEFSLWGASAGIIITWALRAMLCYKQARRHGSEKIAASLKFEGFR